MLKLLVVEDHALVREGLVRLLAQMERGVEVKEAADFETALNVLENDGEFDLVLLDLALSRGIDSHRLLRGSGLLEDRRNGQWVYYRLHPQLPEWASEVLRQTLEHNAEWLRQDVERLWQMRDRPGRKPLCA